MTNSPILEAILARMKEVDGEELPPSSNLESLVLAATSFRIFEILGDDRIRDPGFQICDTTKGIPTHWWNWGNLSVGYAVDGPHLVVFEMKTTKHLLCEDSFADRLMELIEHAATHGSPCQE